MSRTHKRPAPLLWTRQRVEHHGLPLEAEGGESEESEEDELCSDDDLMLDDDDSEVDEVLTRKPSSLVPVTHSHDLLATLNDHLIPSGMGPDFDPIVKRTLVANLTATLESLLDACTETWSGLGGEAGKMLAGDSEFVFRSTAYMKNHQMPVEVIERARERWRKTMAILDMAKDYNINT